MITCWMFLQLHNLILPVNGCLEYYKKLATLELRRVPPDI
jgi:hypothetical protein